MLKKWHSAGNLYDLLTPYFLKKKHLLNSNNNIILWYKNTYTKAIKHWQYPLSTQTPLSS